jgi:hypothetical protein
MNLEEKGVSTAVEDTEALNKNCWWKLKKWSTVITTRIFTRFGHPRYIQDHYRPFSNVFMENYAQPLMESLLPNLSLRPEGKFCSDRVMFASLQYLGSASEVGSLFSILLPNLNFLMIDVLFNELCMKEEDLLIYEEDPQEFIRSNHSIIEEFYDVNFMAANITKEFTANRPEQVLPVIFDFCIQTLDEYEANENKDPYNDISPFITKHGVLNVFIALDDILIRNKQLSSQLEDLMLTHVLPDFTSSVGFMRAKACQVFQHLYEIRFTSLDNLSAILEGIVNCLSDEDLPVRVEASSALGYILKLKQAKEIIQPFLGDIIQQYIAIMGEVEADVFVIALNSLIQRFRKEVIPYLVAVVDSLCQTMANAFDAAIDGDDDASFTVTHCFDTAVNCVWSVRDENEILSQIEPFLVDMLYMILKPEDQRMEYLDGAITLLSYLTYFRDEITQDVWQFFPYLYIAFSDFAPDYIDEMSVPMDNFICRGTEAFVEGSMQVKEDEEPMPFVSMVLHMVQRTFANEYYTEEENRAAAQLLLSVLHNCMNLIDGYVEDILDLVLSKLMTAKTVAFKFKLIQAALSLFIYNTEAAFELFNQKGALEPFFNLLFENILGMRSVLSRRMISLAFNNILASGIYPEGIIQSNLPQLFVTSIRCTHALLISIEEDALLAEEEVGRGDTDDDEVDIFDDDFFDDEENPDFENIVGEEEDIQFTQEEREMRNATMYQKAQRYVNGHLVENDDDDEDDDGSQNGGDQGEDETADDDYTSPLHNIFPSSHFQDMVQTLQSENEGLLNELMGSLGEDDMETFSVIMQTEEPENDDDL